MTAVNAITEKEALELLQAEGDEFLELLARADRARRRAHGNRVHLCAIVNAKSGACPQDCAFCAQSAHNDTDVEVYPLLEEERMLQAARRASAWPIGRFGIVTSGPTLDEEPEIRRVARTVTRVREEAGVAPCASLGMLGRDELLALKEAGLTRYHHNLETAESFFPQICTTQDWKDSVRIVEQAKELGLQVCCGGIFGMGESLEQRVEFLGQIRDLDVDSVPLNFLNPIPGTRLEGLHELTPKDCLRIVAVARLMLPDKEIRVAGGRDVNLRDLQSWIFVAGADGMMIGDYLTTRGRKVDDDLQMLRDLGLEPAA